MRRQSLLPLPFLIGLAFASLVAPSARASCVDSRPFDADHAYVLTAGSYVHAAHGSFWAVGMGAPEVGGGSRPFYYWSFRHTLRIQHLLPVLLVARRDRTLLAEDLPGGAAVGGDDADRVDHAERFADGGSLLSRAGDEDDLAGLSKLLGSDAEQAVVGAGDQLADTLLRLRGNLLAGGGRHVEQTVAEVGDRTVAIRAVPLGQVSQLVELLLDRLEELVDLAVAGPTVEAVAAR